MEGFSKGFADSPACMVAGTAAAIAAPTTPVIKVLRPNFSVVIVHTPKKVF
jgi:hypothetical protein